MNEVVENRVAVENMIFEVRGRQVMLANDVAMLYKTETKRVNEVIKRNKKRFPEEFCFQLTEGEVVALNLRSQIATSSLGGGYGGVRYLPYVLTEQGIMMLSGLLKSDVAVEMNIKIINAFVAMRKYIGGNLLEQKYINNQVIKNVEAISKNTAEIKLLQDSFAKFEEKKMTSEIYFNGQIYDAYSKIYEIFARAREKLIIIDSYADKTILDIVRRLGARVILVTRRGNLLTEQDITKYNKQYHNLTIIYNNTFHDRYFILDGAEVYHCGSSVNRIGSKTFSITRVSDEFVKRALLGRLKNM